MWHLAWIRIGKKSNTMKTRIINWCKTAVYFVHCQWEALELSTNNNFCSSTIKWMRYIAWMRRGKKAKGAADWRQGSFLGVIDLVQLFASGENIYHCRVIFVPGFDTVDVIYLAWMRKGNKSKRSSRLKTGIPSLDAARWLIYCNSFVIGKP